MTETERVPPFPTGLKARGKRLWADMHNSGDFSGCPEMVTVIEEACYLADEIERLRKLIRKAGNDTRVDGYNGQPVSMPEIADLHRNQNTLLAYLKTVRVDPDDVDSDGKLTRSQIGQMGAAARWAK